MIIAQASTVVVVWQEYAVVRCGFWSQRPPIFEAKRSERLAPVKQPVSDYDYSVAITVLQLRCCD